MKESKESILTFRWLNGWHPPTLSSYALEVVRSMPAVFGSLFATPIHWCLNSALVTKEVLKEVLAIAQLAVSIRASRSMS